MLKTDYFGKTRFAPACTYLIMGWTALLALLIFVALVKLLVLLVVIGMQKEGLVVKDVVVLIDREQGGAARMASNGLQLYSAFTLSFILEVLVKNGLVSDKLASSVKSFIADNQTFKQSDAATKAPADAPVADAGASTTVDPAVAAKAAADAACAAPMPRIYPYKR